MIHTKLLSVLTVFLVGFSMHTRAQCTSSAAFAGDGEILRVVFGTLNNVSTCSTTGGTGSILNRYSDYTAVPAPNVSKCSVEAFTVQIGTCGGNYPNGIAIFIDWNNDADFVDAGETAFVSPALTSGPHVETGNITIPASAVTGTVRMRVINAETTPASIVSCGSASYGETEDYLINVVAGAPLAYTSSTGSQLATSGIMTCAANQQILKVEVVAGSGCGSALTEFRLGAGSGTNLPADVSRIHIYYTGTTNAFSAVSEFVPGGTVPAGSTNTITGNQIIVSGTNYFWITYDINPLATPGNLVDASCFQITYSGTAYVPTITDPAGSGTIVVCQAPGAMMAGLDVWLKADGGVSGSTPVTAWGNQNSGGTGITLNGAPSLNTTATNYNYNPYIDFTAPASPRQFLSLTGYNGTAGKDYSGFFFVSQLNDLSRTYTHLATANGITYGSPPNGTLHGEAVGTTAAILLAGMEVTDFGTSSPAGTWQRNGANVLSNASHISTKQVLSASSAGITTINRFLGGQDDNGGFLGSTRDYKGYVAEIIAYTGTISAVQRQRIHSYLAVKYGITLPVNYLNAGGSVIFTPVAPYTTNIMGIGRDDETALLQKQSHNNDDTTRIFLSSLAATNLANTGSFSTNKSYVMTGANTGRMQATAASNVEVPPGITSRIEREWNVTNTNFSGTFSMSFVLSSSAGLPNVNPAHLVLLVDDDGNFTNATVYGAGSGLTFSYANPVVTVSGISTAHIAMGLTRYLTLASTNTLTPLPVELVTFTGECHNHSAILKWTTATETNNRSFTIERSTDGIDYKVLATMEGHNTSVEKQNYSYTDHTAEQAMYYYRLKQTNTNGSFHYSDPISLEGNCVEQKEANPAVLNLYPNPAGDQFLHLEYVSDKDQQAVLSFRNVLGQEVYSVEIALKKDGSLIDLDIDKLDEGMYVVQFITPGTQSKTLKLVRHTQ